MIVQRVEKHLIKKSNKYYSMLNDFCIKSKNLYNHANYILRNEFCNSKKYIKYNDIDKILKNDLEYDDYKQMPSAQSSQQILRLLDKNWKSFFKSIKDWSKNKSKYSGKPKLPGYKPKDGKFLIILTNQNAKLKDGIIKFPKTFRGFEIKPKFTSDKRFTSFQQVRIIPKNKFLVVELIYNIDIHELKEDNKRYYGIDLGLDNLAAVSNNVGSKPFIINGKGLKSMNKYYNKLKAHYQEKAKIINNKNFTNRMCRIETKRNNKINDTIHKSSRYIVNRALKDNVNRIIIGNNKDWKRNSNIGKVNNQSFVSIPYVRLIDMIKYKAEECGIKVIITEESYTSGTSFLDLEMPTKENYNKSRRIKRGLFKSNTGRLINADINGSLQIIKKVVPNAFADGIEGVVLHPVVINN